MQAASAPAAASSADGAGGDAVVERVLAIVSQQTGYPREMLDLELDLEADLGIDTVKQAETFAAIREAFGIPRRDDLKLRDYPTLEKVIGFVREMRPDLAAAPTAAVAQEAPADPVVQASRPVSASLEDADRVPRRVPIPALRPPLEWCKPTGVKLDGESRIVVALDQGGVGRALVERLQKRGATVLTIDPSEPAENLEAQLQAWLNEGMVQGVYWLAALDVEPHLEEIALATWRELNRQRTKNLYRVMRLLYESVSGRGAFLVVGTRLGGLHGYGADGATAPLGGAVVGFAKAYKRERPEVLVKAVDFEISRKTAALADALIAETLTDPGAVEIGYHNDRRFTVALVEEPAADGNPGLALTSNTVFVVTGAAGGITSAIVADLASASGGIFYLLDLATLPDPHDPNVNLFRTNRDALKARLIEQAKAAGERPTPAQIDRQILNIERQEAALRAVEAVQAAGGTAHYYSLNLLDEPAVTAVVDAIRSEHGRIDVLIHAGGLEISRSLADKDPAQFDLVFDVKADGFFNLLRAAKGMPIGATVAFSSVAGRFGNNGQTDYSAANDLLCKLTSSLRRWRPETRGIAIDWTAWGGIGMATRGSIPKIMEMAGIDMLPPESGVPTVRRELVVGGFRGEIVVGNRLGVLGSEWDETGGLDSERVNQWLAERKPPLVMIGKVTAAKLYGGLKVETTLDPKVQPFLYDHQMDGTPLLPGVMGTEAFAQLASVAAPGYQVAAVMNERFHNPFKFYRMEPQTLHLSVLVCPLEGDDLVARAVLRSVRHIGTPDMPPQEKVHFTADVRLTRAEMPKPSANFTPPDPAALNVRSADIYRVYFHGPAYQVLEGASVEDGMAIGLMASNLPPNTSPAEAASLMAPRLIELCFQTAGIWEMKTRDVMALPLSIQSVTVYRQPEEAAGRRLYALVQAQDDGLQFNAEVIDEQGAVYVVMTGYRTVQLPGSVTL